MSPTNDHGLESRERNRLATSSSAASIYEDPLPFWPDTAASFRGEAPSSLPTAGTNLDGSPTAPAVDDKICADYDEINSWSGRYPPAGEPEAPATAVAVAGDPAPAVGSPMYTPAFTCDNGTPSEVGPQTPVIYEAERPPFPHGKHDANAHGAPPRPGRPPADGIVDPPELAEPHNSSFDEEGWPEDLSYNSLDGRILRLLGGAFGDTEMSQDALREYADQEALEAARLDAPMKDRGPEVEEFEGRESEVEEFEDRESGVEESEDRESEAEGLEAQESEVEESEDRESEVEESEDRESEADTSLSSQDSSGSFDYLSPQAPNPAPARSDDYYSEYDPSTEPGSSSESDGESVSPSRASAAVGDLTLLSADHEEEEEEVEGEGEGEEWSQPSSPNIITSPIATSTPLQNRIGTDETTLANSPLGGHGAGSGAHGVGEEDLTEPDESMATDPPSRARGGAGETTPSSPVPVTVPFPGTGLILPSQAMVTPTKAKRRKRASDVDENSSSPFRGPGSGSKSCHASPRPRKRQRTKSYPFSERQEESEKSEPLLPEDGVPPVDVSF